MRRQHRILPLVPVALILAFAAVASAQIPDRLTDQEFWKLTENISEPDGAFRSDNLLSN